MSYRSSDPGPYGVWEQELSSLELRLVQYKLLRRWVVRWGTDRDFPDASYHDSWGAMMRLHQERATLEHRPRMHVFDRLTGKCFSPPPDVLEDLIYNRCRVCGAEGDEPCDAGLHS